MERKILHDAVSLFMGLTVYVVTYKYVNPCLYDVVNISCLSIFALCVTVDRQFLFDVQVTVHRHIFS